MTCESVQWLKRRKRCAALLKLDFRKAFDSIHWFLLIMFLKEWVLVESRDLGSVAILILLRCLLSSKVPPRNHFVWNEDLDKGTPCPLSFLFSWLRC